MSEDSVRDMTLDDLGLVRSWRNHPEVRRFMYTTHEIGEDEHRAWFERASANPAMTLLIYERDGEPRGFVNISRSRSEAVADWGFYLAPEAEKGTGRKMGNRALAYAFATLGLHKLCGQALGFNERSIAFHKALGFREEGRLRDQHFDGATYHDVVCFGLLADEWNFRK